MTKDAVIRRGQAADRLLKDETVLSAFESLIEDLQDEWIRSRPDDTAAREACYRMVHAVQSVMAKLQTWRANGLMEEGSAAARDQAGFH